MVQVFEIFYKPLYGGKVRKEYRKFYDATTFKVITKKEYTEQNGIKKEFDKGQRMAELEAKTLSGLLQLTETERKELAELVKEWAKYLETFEKLFLV